MRRSAFVVLACGVRAARADPEFEPLTEPLPMESYIQLAPSYTVGSREAELDTKGVVVYRGLVWPDLARDRTATALRLEAPLQRGGGDTGLGPMTFTAVSAATWGRNAFGVGFALVLPTATSPAFGDDALQVGPTVFAQLVEIPHLELSVLVHEVATVSGTSSHRWSTRIEPGVSVKLPSDVFLASDADITFSGLGHDATVPVNLLLGRDFGEHLVVSAGPQINVAGVDRGDVTLQIKVSFTGLGR